MSDLQKLVFEDITEQWIIVPCHATDGTEMVCAYASNVLFVTKRYDIIHHGYISKCGREIYDRSGTVLADRIRKVPPEPKYVPFASAEEARAVVGWEPWVKRKEESDVRRKIDFWNKTGACSYVWDELSESILWSNTPDDDTSWKPFGKLVTE